MPFSVSLECGPDAVDVLLAELMDFATAGVEQTPSGLVVHFESRADAETCRRHFSAHRPQLSEIPSANWAEEWQSHWRPMRVGRRFYLSPPWLSDAAPEGRIRLEMQPGLVFGGGDHPTTQLCLGLLEDFVRPGASVADIGSGSGILTRAAQKLGAGKLIACDLDPAAVTATQRFAPGAIVYCGSVDALRPGQADVLVANLLTGILVGLMPRFAAVARASSIVILSGFLRDQMALMSARAASHGFRVLREAALDDWAALALTNGD